MDYSANPLIAVCWCGSDNRCPHEITDKFFQKLEESEKIIDNALLTFDRNEYKKYLKRNVDGRKRPLLDFVSQKPGLSDSYGYTKSEKELPDPNRSKNLRAQTAAKRAAKRLKTGNVEIPESSDSPKRANTALHLDRRDKPNTLKSDFLSNDPPIDLSKSLPTKFHRNVMTETLPKLPPRAISTSQDTRPSTSSKRLLPGDKSKGRSTPANLMPSNAWGTMQGVEVPEDANISVALIGIAESFSRDMLPWQSALCPRAIEALYDSRLEIITQKHLLYLEEMGKKLFEEQMKSPLMTIKESDGAVYDKL